MAEALLELMAEFALLTIAIDDEFHFPRQHRFDLREPGGEGGVWEVQGIGDVAGRVVFGRPGIEKDRAAAPEPLGVRQRNGVRCRQHDGRGGR